MKRKFDRTESTKRLLSAILKNPTAPFRETAAAIAAAREAGILAVEMEAAALYAFATARERPVLCFAHVTNQMGRVDGDFEKGVADGAEDALKVVTLVGRGWRSGEPADARAGRRTGPPT